MSEKGKIEHARALGEEAAVEGWEPDEMGHGFSPEEKRAFLEGYRDNATAGQQWMDSERAMELLMKANLAKGRLRALDKPDQEAIKAAREREMELLMKANLAKGQEAIKAARSMGADMASEDKTPDPPDDFTPEQRIAYLEAFEGTANDWAEDLRDRAADADEMRSQIEPEAEAAEPPSKRGEPNIGGDCYTHGYMVIDDEGDPVGNVHFSIVRANKYRALKGVPKHRIVMVGVKVLAEEAEVVDDPRLTPEIVKDYLGGLVDEAFSEGFEPIGHVEQILAGNREAGNVGWAL